MGEFTLELDQGVGHGVCGGCGTETQTVRGYIYEDGAPFALYFAQLYPGHDDRKLALDIAIGDWDEQGEASTRLRVGLEVWPEADEYRMSVQSAQGWPWKDSDVFGTLLDRDEALAHAAIDTYFLMADRVVEGDARISRYLNE